MGDAVVHERNGAWSRAPNVRWLLSWLLPVPHRPRVYGGEWLVEERDRPPIYTHRYVGWLWLGRPRRMRWEPIR